MMPDLLWAAKVVNMRIQNVVGVIEVVIMVVLL